MENVIYLTEQDYKRLVDVVQQQRQSLGAGENLARLGEELKRARRVNVEDIPANVVTMNSRVRLRNLGTNADMEITLVYPKDADVNARRISVLAPVGTAIIGCREGDEISWPAPAGTLHFKIEKVMYQPEASGNYTL